MAGTKAGGAKARDRNKELYGEDYYQKIGAAGGKVSKEGGFAYLKKHNPERLSELGAKGGAISRRGPSKGGYIK